MASVSPVRTWKVLRVVSIVLAGVCGVLGVILLVLAGLEAAWPALIPVIGGTAGALILTGMIRDANKSASS